VLRRRYALLPQSGVVMKFFVAVSSASGGLNITQGGQRGHRVSSKFACKCDPLISELLSSFVPVPEVARDDRCDNGRCKNRRDYRRYDFHG
jgi:hypothetical protein